MRERIRPNLRTALLACSVASIGSLPGAAYAQPAAQRAVLAPAPLQRASRVGPHHVFGTIVALRGGVLSIRLRNGRLLTVDATAAIANDDYSYPLFVGKTVGIDGTLTAKATLIATHVTAVTSLQSLGADK